MNTATTAKRRYRGSAVEERRAQRRQQLIDAAIEVYGSNGYRHSGVKQVCDAAGLTQRYFYESFGHSDELLIAAYEQAARSVRESNMAAAEAVGSDRVVRSRAKPLSNWVWRCWTSVFVLSGQHRRLNVRHKKAPHQAGLFFGPVIRPERPEWTLQLSGKTRFR